MSTAIARRATQAAVLAAATLGLALGACQNQNKTAYTGPCEPTVEGSSGNAYHNYDDAQAAFTRITPDGSFSAILEDVAWLRFEGDEAEVVQKHRAYFDQGYTTFAVTLLTLDFIQPTTETYVLEDSSGVRLTARPCSYRGNMAMENERYAARFDVSFRHSLTRDLAWIRLTRPGCTSSLEWMFPAAGVGGQPACAPPPAHTGPITRGALPKGQPLYRPLNPAPGPIDPAQPTGKPVNILTQPAAPVDPGASAVPPPAFPSASAAPSSAVPPPQAPPPVPPAAPAPDFGTPPSGPLPPPESRSVR